MSEALVLEFTGERYTEIAGNIALEHIHRYAMARDLVQGKDVLDIASGEGYGSLLLAESARSVVEVDVAADVVAHAGKKYKRANLQFSVGSCAAIPLDDASVDVVVSFETIEHHDEHDKMMVEIKRVLRPGGLVLISTPDALEYAAVTNGPNPHHVKELSYEEFIGLLGIHFRQVAVLDQRVSYGSNIIPRSAISGFTNYRLDDGRLRSFNQLSRTLYYVAITSDSELPAVDSSLFELQASGRDILDALLEQKAANEQRLARLRSDVFDRDASILHLSAQHDEMLASRSWRVTAPLRFFVRAYRHLSGLMR